MPFLPGRLRLSADDGSSTYEIFPAHSIGVNAVSWAPAIVPGSLTVPQQQQQQQPNGGAPAAPGASQSSSSGGIIHQKRFASAGCDTAVRIWSYKGADTKPEIEDELTGHTDWVRDVAWAPNIGLPGEYIATASQVRVVAAIQRRGKKRECALMAHSFVFCFALLRSGPHRPHPLPAGHQLSMDVHPTDAEWTRRRSSIP